MIPMPSLTHPVPHWWLLVSSVAIQALFFAGLVLWRLKAKDAPIPIWLFVPLGVGSVLGLAFGLVQSDAVFVLGQACVLLLVLRAAWKARRQGQPEAPEDHA